ncbi:MAG TPA: HTH-type transcriptional repressor FabR [Rhodocyclaceae bacterium]|nr:HTH-type transcriptional repressor FabR [Rhodocyclaceae bacterium]
MNDNSPLPTASAPGRKPTISREDIVAAALKLVGPHRSVSTLSLREVAREAGIAPNSFYRHFRDMDELAVALIDLAGQSLRRLIGEARRRANHDRSVVRSSVEAFMEQLRADDGLLHLLLREGTVGSDAFKRAVDRQLNFFEEELRQDLIYLADINRTGLFEPALTAKAITRLVFALGATAMELSAEKQHELTEQLVLMVRMIVTGTQTMAITGTPDSETRDNRRLELL